METQSLAPARTVPIPVPVDAGLAGAGALLLGRRGGGLQGIGLALEQAGCGDRFQSWVGAGPNLPISGPEIRRALAPTVLAIASASSRDPARVAEGLAVLLPRLVDALTPAGRLPPAGRLGIVWGLARLMWRARRVRA